MADILLIAAAYFFLYKRTLRYLRIFQQEEYKPGRFCRWVFARRAFDTRATSLLVVGFVASHFFSWVSLVTAALLAGIAMAEEDPRKVGKVTLKMTLRAKQIFYLSLALGATLMLLPLWLALVALVQLSPLLLILANGSLLPYERQKQKKFLNEAKAILADVSPFVIGITGSFGKTSTKDALAKMLQVTLGPTFWPPKSYNTPMGITKEIRERLVRGYEYAVIEMGAYQIGSIERICSLTPPDAAIITGIGKCHLDRFGSLDNIVLAKSELARAVPESGILVCNGDNEGARAIAEQHKKAKTYLYGFDASLGPLDAWVSCCQISEMGTHFTLHWQKRSYHGHTPLIGRSALSNAVGAFTMACALGADPEFVVAVMKSLEPVNNRLQLKKSGEIFYLHDAYNSNPAGFRSALAVLQAIPAKRRIIMTPGMIELGAQQPQENYQVAKLAGGCCDIALVVGDTNSDALVKGFQEAGLQEIHLCNTREAAFVQLSALQKEGDIILIENDLTDLYEAKAKF